MLTWMTFQAPQLREPSLGLPDSRNDRQARLDIADALHIVDFRRIGANLGTPAGLPWWNTLATPDRQTSLAFRHRRNVGCLSFAGLADVGLPLVAFDTWARLDIPRRCIQSAISSTFGHPLSDIRSCDSAYAHPGQRP